MVCATPAGNFPFPAAREGCCELRRNANERKFKAGWEDKTGTHSTNQPKICLWRQTIVNGSGRGVPLQVDPMDVLNLAEDKDPVRFILTVVPEKDLPDLQTEKGEEFIPKTLVNICKSKMLNIFPPKTMR